jgi:hypothetical protein
MPFVELFELSLAGEAKLFEEEWHEGFTTLTFAMCSSYFSTQL